LVVNGPLGRNASTERITNYLQAADANLENQFKEFCNMEFAETEDTDKTTLSREDQRALQVMNESITLKDGHEVALPWKKTTPKLPNNRAMAERRLKFLKKRLDKDPQLLKNYSNYIDDLVKKGYARKIPEERLTPKNSNVCYLPHHPVFHPQKPGKTRVVFDCSAKFEGTSQND
jgi:vacuolar-type H+-ATPase subunit B/Vma2